MPGKDESVRGLLREYAAYLKEEGVQRVPKGRPVAKKPRKAKPAAEATAAPKASAMPTAERPSVAAPPVQAPVAAAPKKVLEAAPRRRLSSENAPGTTLETIAAEVLACDACGLCAERQHAVPGEGNGDRPEVMFIGEGPGADEDAQGRPFVGRSGRLLTDMIRAMGYTREEVFIGNIVKCRPPGNRTPTPSEMAWCMPFLLRQIALIRPQSIVCLGLTAARGLLGFDGRLGDIRGQWSDFQGIPVMVTYHPAFLLRDPNRKGDCWRDLQQVMAKFGRKRPPAQAK